jgi:hypothetical protein
VLVSGRPVEVILRFAPGLILAFSVSQAIGLFLGSAIYHLLVATLVRPNAGFQATNPKVAYASAELLLSWLSTLGYAATLYGYYLAYVGIRELHETAAGRALTITFIAFVLEVLNRVFAASFLFGIGA